MTVIIISIILVFNAITSLFSATQDQVEKAKDLVKKLKFKFNSDNFENPVLQKHWRNIEALALERDEVEEIDDHTCKKCHAILWSVTMFCLIFLSKKASI